MTSVLLSHISHLIWLLDIQLQWRMGGFLRREGDGDLLRRDGQGFADDEIGTRRRYNGICWGGDTN